MSEYKIKPHAWSPPNAGDHTSLHGILYKLQNTVVLVRYSHHILLYCF